jgi:uncharacterized membrane protein YphA (DoxX/SURF4 family)
MKLSDSTARAWAICFARSILGIIFFMAGMWKVFDLGPLEHARRFFLLEPLYEFHTHVIPRAALLIFVLVMPRGDDRFSIDHVLTLGENRQPARG